MNQKSKIVLTLILLTIAGGATAAVIVQDRAERKVKKVTRVARPKYSPRDWDGIYFEDVFAQGLVGARPEKSELPPVRVASQTAGPGASAQPTGSPAGAWSGLISRGTIENEVKALQNQLSQDVTTPVKFKTEYAKAHQAFSILSMMFAVIRQYDGEVRWQRFAGEAQASFQRAAANSRVGTVQAFESCRRRKEDLQEMVRGGNFAGDEKAPDELNWSEVVLRSPVMERLQTALDRLKVATSSDSEFEQNAEQVVHEAELVAAMAKVIIAEEMPDAAEDDYVEFARQMMTAATQTVSATKNQDFDLAAENVNLIGQSCSNCHDQWR